MMRAIGVQVERAFVFPVLGFLLLSLVGCGTRDRGEAAPMPPRDDVEKITITVVHPLVKGAAPCEAVLTKDEAIVPVLDWLNKIDWSQGEDMTPIRLPDSDGRIVIYLKDGTKDSLGWYWDGKLTSQRRNLLVRTDRTKLQKVIQAACQ